MNRATPTPARSAYPGALSPVDRLLLGALAALAVTAGVVHPAPLPFLALYGALAVFVVAAARRAPRSRAAEALHVFGPLAVLVAVYQTVGFVVAAATPTRWDGALAAIDARALGPLVAAWRGALGRPPWLTDLLSLFYVSYYLVPLAMAIALHRRGERDAVERFAFALQLTLLLTYTGYFLFPAAGPRVPAAEAQAALGGGAASRAVRAFLYTCELNRLDAFPSGHTAVALVFAALGWRLLPAWRAPVAAVAAGIVVSTVYLSHHYAIDVVAGALVAAGALAAAEPLRHALARPAPHALAPRPSP